MYSELSCFSEGSTVLPSAGTKAPFCCDESAHFTACLAVIEGRLEHSGCLRDLSWSVLTWTAVVEQVLSGAHRTAGI